MINTLSQKKLIIGHFVINPFLDGRYFTFRQSSSFGHPRWIAVERDNGIVKLSTLSIVKHLLVGFQYQSS